MKYRATILFILSLIAPALGASDYSSLFSFVEQCNGYLGQSHHNHQIGMGIINDGKKIYVGDVYEGKPSGTGIMINYNGEIDKNYDACYYVGSFEDGKPNGMGRLYRNDGSLDLDGKFEKGKVARVFPNTDGHVEPTFGPVTVSNMNGIGETLNGKPNGWAVVISESESAYILGTAENGIFVGPCLTIWDPATWEVRYYKRNGAKYGIPVSTVSYQNIEGKRVAEFQQSMSEAKHYFSKAGTTALGLAAGAAGVGSEYKDAKSVAGLAQDVSSMAESTPVGSSKSSSSSTSASTKKKEDEHKHNGEWWRGKTRAYDGYVTQVSNMQAKDNIDLNHLKSIQSKMKAIRKEVEADNWPITQAPQETWHP